MEQERRMEERIGMGRKSESSEGLGLWEMRRGVIVAV